MFQDRYEAGKQLAKKLIVHQDASDTIVMALPRGGVVPGYVIASDLNLPLELAMVKKLGHPDNPEYAIGAVSLTGRVLNEHYNVSNSYIEKETERIRELLRKRSEIYHREKQVIKLTNKTVIVVDDGIATGQTMLVALELISSENPKKIIVAVPVASYNAIKTLAAYADEVICLESDSSFSAIGQYYSDFSQVSDEEVMILLEKAALIKD